jgi:peptide/nickel transport system permease protein
MTTLRSRSGRGEEIIEIKPPTLQKHIQKMCLWFSDAFAELYKSKTAFAGAIMLVSLIIVLLCAPILSEYNPVKADFSALIQEPSDEHLFGTDRYGRDIFSRVLWGGRRLVSIAIAAVVFGLVLGIPVGILSGYYGGYVDAVAMRVVDGLLAFPGILLYLLLVTLAREWHLEGFWNDLILVFALGFAFSPEAARLSRGAVLTEKHKEYVEASHNTGEANYYIAFRQIGPNCISPLIVESTVRLGYAILIIAALSFLGLGTPPPTPDWGSDLSAARDHMETNPYVAIFPGLAICYTVLAFNLFGDGLRDILDPRVVDR